MKRLFPLALGASVVLALSGCAAPPAPANGAMLTFETKPEGATLYEGKLELGVAPVTRTYHAVGSSTSITTPEVTAVWPSGAKTTFFTYLDVGADRVATLERPTSAPGMDVDVKHGAKVTEARLEREQSEAREVTHRLTRDSAKCNTQREKGSASGDCA